MAQDLTACCVSSQQRPGALHGKIKNDCILCGAPSVRRRTMGSFAAFQAKINNSRTKPDRFCAIFIKRRDFISGHVENHVENNFIFFNNGLNIRIN